VEIKQHAPKKPMDQRQKSKIKFKQYLKTSGNWKTPYQILWNVAKAVLRRK
jgi:hypothetical protein